MCTLITESGGVGWSPDMEVCKHARTPVLNINLNIEPGPPFWLNGIKHKSTMPMGPSLSIAFEAHGGAPQYLYPLQHLRPPHWPLVNVSVDSASHFATWLQKGSSGYWSTSFKLSVHHWLQRSGCTSLCIESFTIPNASKKMQKKTTKSPQNKLKWSRAHKHSPKTAKWPEMACNPEMAPKKGQQWPPRWQKKWPQITKMAHKEFPNVHKLVHSHPN